METIHGPLLIIAGAGSGKTRVITYRIAQMLDHHIPQNHILALTFTNKAAREMEHRVKELTGRKLTNLTVSTFHSFGLQVMREKGESLGYNPHLTVYDSTDTQSLIRDASRELGMDFEPGEIQTLAGVFSAVKTGRRNWEGFDENIRKLYQEYHDHLKLYNALDFDDLIVKPVELWDTHKEILEEYRLRFQYILVDEFQDTSLGQYEMVRLLASEHRNLCVVGDDDQSIYSWRGANYRNIQEFEKDFPERAEIKLEQNYRSTGNILAAANAVIINNLQRKPKALRTTQSVGSVLEIVYPEDDNEEADFIVKTIKTLFVRENRPYSDFGVLVRTNSLTRNLETVFLRENVPYSVTGGTSFMERKEVKDISSYLRVLSSPSDDMNFLRILNVPKRGLGRAVLENILKMKRSRGISAWEAARLLSRPGNSPIPPTAAAELSVFLETLGSFRSKLGNGVGRKNAELAKELVEEIEMEKHIREENKNEKVAEWKFQNIEHFLTVYSDWEKNPENDFPSLSVFLNRMMLSNHDEDNDKKDKGAVNLMTIHSAKGLEFPIVFLLGVEDGILPHARSLEENAQGMEEERRLFYVAITRAQKKLYLTSCLTRKTQKENMQCRPSPFLSEIPAQLLQVAQNQDEFQEGEADALFLQLKKKLGI